MLRVPQCAVLHQAPTDKREAAAWKGPSSMVPTQNQASPSKLTSPRSAGSEVSVRLIAVERGEEMRVQTTLVGVIRATTVWGSATAVSQVLQKGLSRAKAVGAARADRQCRYVCTVTS